MEQFQLYSQTKSEHEACCHELTYYGGDGIVRRCGHGRPQMRVPGGVGAAYWRWLDIPWWRVMTRLRFLWKETMG